MSETTAVHGEQVSAPRLEQLESFTCDREGLRACWCRELILLVDTTGSVGGTSTIGLELSCVVDMAATAGYLRVGLITFEGALLGQGDGVYVIHPLTYDLNAVKASLENLPVFSPGGGGFPPEASDEALREMLGGDSPCVYSGDFNPRYRRSCQKLAVLVTDAPPGGCDDPVDSRPEDVARAHQRALEAAAQGIQIAAISIGGKAPASVMQDYADTTGGLYAVVAADGSGMAQALFPILTPCDCNLNSVADYEDIATGHSDDCNEDDIPDECQAVVACGEAELLCEPNEDFDDDGIENGVDNCPCDSNPLQDDCDRDGIGDVCETDADCDANGTPDKCEIAEGAADCQGDNILDVCQLEGNDCNSNGVPDECEPACGIRRTRRSNA